MKPLYRFGLLGNNIDYSKSPEIFRIIGALADAEIEFDLYDIPSHDLTTFMASIRDLKLNGLAVTIPHKEEVVPFMTKCFDVAERLGAVNSIKITPNALEGYNTDWHGLTYSLAPFRDQIEGGRALVLGAGGSARAVAYAICGDMRVRHITILGRSAGPMERLQRMCHELGVEAQTALFAEYHGFGEKYSLVVNCTPLGGWHYVSTSPIPAGLEWKHVGLYFDMNYNDGNIAVRTAKEHGVVAVDGSRMLIGQAAKSFEIWTGQSVNIEQLYHMVFLG